MCGILQAAPFYRIFVADARAPRDGKHIDVVGHFDPIPGIACRHSDQFIFTQACTITKAASVGKDGNKHITLNIERIK